jgi:hypothetical protein
MAVYSAACVWLWLCAVTSRHTQLANAVVCAAKLG